MIRDGTLITKRAIEQRWDIPAEDREDIIREMMAVVRNGESDRSKIAAVRALIAMEEQNQSDEHNATLQQDRNRFLEIAEQLGFQTADGYISEKRTVIDSETTGGTGG